jgi:hypothetical protein
VGRRRHACYARIEIDEDKGATQQKQTNATSSSKKQKTTTMKSKCKISQNMAAYLRLRQDDPVKIVPLTVDDETDQRSGDLKLIQTKPEMATSITYAPVEDSLQALVAGEGGDDLADEEIQERFVQPYLEQGEGLLKQGQLLVLRDENGKKLEFYVSHMDFETEDEDTEESEKTKAVSKGKGSSLNFFGICDPICLSHVWLQYPSFRRRRGR